MMASSLADIFSSLKLLRCEDSRNYHQSFGLPADLNVTPAGEGLHWPRVSKQ